MRSPCDGTKDGDANKGKNPLNDLVGKYNIIEPYWILPTPSPWCNENWTYNNLGTDWQCRCWDGDHQSPIDLPPIERLELLNTGASIEFFKVDTEMVVEKNFVSL